MSDDAVLVRVDARVDETAAAALCHHLFDVAGRAERLTGERDQNFRITAADGRRFLLKLSHSAEDPRVTDLQTRALAHIAAIDPSLPLPRLQAGRDGAWQADWIAPGGDACVVRLLTFLPGEPLSDLAIDDDRLDAVGVALARLDAALQDFRHPAERHELLWDLQRADRSREHLPAVEDDATRALATRGLDLFESEAAPRLSALRTQFIHNDLNPHNVLIDAASGGVSGILDLGDAVRAPLVNDVAIAAAYHVREAPDPLGAVVALLRGYARVLPLEPAETAVLLPLIAGRLAMTVAITAWRARLDPANRPYILRNAAVATAGLRSLLRIAPDEAAERFGRLEASAP